MTEPGSRLPLIVLVAPLHDEVLRGEFARYARDYDVRRTATAAATSELLREARAPSPPSAPPTG